MKTIKPMKKYGKKHNHPKKGKVGERKVKRVSAIVPTYNRDFVLENTIVSLLEQTHPLFEIIIVDDNSTDKTKELVKKYQKSHKQIKYIKNEKNLNPAGSRNKGLEVAKGEIILFTDSDCFVPKDWLKKMVGEYNNKEVIGVGGYLEPAKNNWVANLERLQNKYLLKIGKERVEGKQECPTGYTSSMTYKTEVLKRVKGFNQDLISGEEIDLKKRICQGEGKIVFLPEPVIHLESYDLEYLLDRLLNRGLGKRSSKGIVSKMFYTIYMFPVIMFNICSKLIRYKKENLI